MTVPMDLEGAAAPPRSNGELVFAEPWESRAFAMAVALNQADAFTWQRFQAALIARIARWEAAPTNARGGATTTIGSVRSRMCSAMSAPCAPPRSPHVPTISRCVPAATITAS